MKTSHEQIEQLLGESSPRAHVGEGFAEGVSRSIAGTTPGTAPVAKWVMPASMKAGVTLGVVGVVSAAVWVGLSGAPAPESPAIADNQTQTPAPVPSHNTQSVAALGDFVGALANLQAQLPRAGSDPDPVNVVEEGRKLVTNARQLGLSFLSAFPTSWTEMLLGDTLFSGGRDKPTGEASQGG